MGDIVEWQASDLWEAWELAAERIRLADEMHCEDRTVPFLDRRQIHSQAIMSERSAAQWSGQPWAGFEFTTRKMGDVGDFEVKTTQLRNGGLLLNAWSDPKRIFMFVPRYSKLSWEIAGWMHGEEVIQPRWHHRERRIVVKGVLRVLPEYWLVPRTHLRPMEEFGLRR